MEEHSQIERLVLEELSADLELPALPAPLPVQADSAPEDTAPPAETAETAPVVLVKPRLLSQAVGQRQQNLLALRRDWPGLSIRPAEEIEEDFLILYQRKEENREQEVRYAAEGD